MTSLTERLANSLVGLHMPDALEALPRIIRSLEQGDIPALEAIDKLLLEEYTKRESKRVGVALQTSRLLPMKTLESFDFPFQPSLDRDRIMALAELSFIERGEGVHRLGPPGTGKTHRATALGVKAVRAGKRVYRITLAELIDKLIQAERAGRLQAKMRSYVHPSLLIIDEIGFLPIPPGGASLFFQRVNARYEKGAMILTSTLGFADGGEMFGDPVMATALLDRLLHHAVVITITGHSYRLREHRELIPDHVRTNKSLVPPPPPKKRTTQIRATRIESMKPQALFLLKSGALFNR